MGVESFLTFHYGLNFLFFAVCILFTCLFCDGSSLTNKCVETERQALLKFKDAVTLGRHDLIPLWNSEEYCCKWEGISCDNLTGHVISLTINSINSPSLKGNIDSSICELQHLTSLDLSYNSLKGKIPKCIGSLGELNLSNNELVGVIPSTLGNLSKLQTLDLRNNNLVSNDLEWLSHLSILKYLDLSGTNLSVANEWLSSITKIPFLSELHLSKCGLYQVNPELFPHLNSSTSLEILDLSSNNLNSSILSWLVNSRKLLVKKLKLLSLSSNKFSSHLGESIQQLCSQSGLEWLDLGNNSFRSGPLPDFSCFSSLQTLYLQNANVVGPLLSQSFGHLPSLTYLYLSHNQINGVDIINEEHLSNLSTLYLDFNHLSGSLPLFEVSKLVSLEELNLSNNQLNGSLQYIGKLSNLMWLFLSSNKLNGVITEAHLSNLSRLQLLDVAQNSLIFNLSPTWVPPFQNLEILYASPCTLGPKFPMWIKHLPKLSELEISNSGISDSFPEWFWSLSSRLSYLNVSHNKLIGTLPKSFSRMIPKDDDVWDFSFNNLSGPLPPFPELYALFLSNNMFSGTLTSFCKSSPLYLSFLDLSSNSLMGPLPDCWGKFQHLQVLNVAKNNLSGILPNSIGTLREMELIHLNSNNFFGTIPSMAFCSNLKLIDVGDNNLQGRIPLWIGRHLHQLIVLRLRANNFRGEIPTSLCNLTFLQVLDLSENSITGNIPQCFSHITALSNSEFPRKTIFYFLYEIGYLSNYHQIGSFSEKVILAWKGVDREYGKNLGLMTTIDLSCNHLIGEIPQSITKLVALAGLNISGNNLTGSIPNNIGHMEMLESLDLSRNHLYGRMPTSFSNLTFLSYMNLSFNMLSGKIPVSTQLQSFGPSTYEGNNGLCGAPLSNHCLGDVISPIGSPNKHVSNEDDDELITFGFFVSLGLGFFVGFWGVCGTLVIKTSWRHAYFQFFNNRSNWVHVTVAVYTARMKNRFHVQD